MPKFYDRKKEDGPRTSADEIHESHSTEILHAAKRRARKRAEQQAEQDWTKPPPEEPKKRLGPHPRLGMFLTPSDREVEVLRWIAAGHTNYEIARKMFLSEETVKSHVRHLLPKLQARNRAHLVARGYQTGLLTTGSPSR